MQAHLVHLSFAIRTRDTTQPAMEQQRVQGRKMANTYPTVAEAARVSNSLAQSGNFDMSLANTL